MALSDNEPSDALASSAEADQSKLSTATLFDPAFKDESSIFSQGGTFNEQWRLMKIQLETLQSKLDSLESPAKSEEKGEAEAALRRRRRIPGMKPEKFSGEGEDYEDDSEDSYDSREDYEEQELDTRHKVIQVNRPRLWRSPRNSARAPARPQLHYVEWSGFKNVCLEERVVYAIDVLIGPAKFYWQRHSEEKAKRRQVVDGTLNSARGSYEPTTDKPLKVGREMPERIRINSEHLLFILSDIVSEIWRLTPTVLLRPYKLLVLHDADIRQWLRELESKWAVHIEPDPLEEGVVPEPKKASSVQNDAETVMDGEIPLPPSREILTGEDKAEDPPERLSDSPKALLDLRCLVGFMDTYISPVVERYRSSTAQKIFFRDLWYLFKPGDEVVCSQDLDSVIQKKSVSFSADTFEVTTQRISKRGAQTMWKVLQVLGGRPILGPPQLERTSSSDRGRPPAQPITPFRLLCYMIGYDGVKFGPIKRVFDISSYEGEKDISDLDIVPARMVQNAEQLKDKFRAQGLKFMAFTAPSHQFYTGPSLMHHPGGISCNLTKRSENIDGNVIVDFKEAVRSDKQWVLTLGIPERITAIGLETIESFPVSYWKDVEQNDLIETKEEGIYDDTSLDRPMMEEFMSKDPFLSAFKNRLNDDQVDGSDFTDNELVLLPDRVCAFNLHRRSFSIIGLQGLRNVEVQTEGWSDLKLPRGHKKMVQAQVEIHFREKKLREEHIDRSYDYDLVRGKGQGLIILLHGAPGVGKTSTAECVAESLKRPLYPITCGDLGVSAKEVEETLAETFAKAEAWDCVLLLDEADVFLAQRTRTDLKRNAIVSVFLRVLEYYKGILFLTTNRVGAFDEAFKSRIHLHLYYPVLNRDQTKSIWRMNLDRMIKRKGDMMSFDESGIMEYAENHFDYHKQKHTRWNGRQIHNAFRTAAALAEYEVQDTQDKRIRRPGLASNTSDDQPTRARLEVEHFKIVADASHQFDAYISETTGGTEAERALIDRDRADDFKWTSTRQQDFSQPRQPYQPPQYQHSQQQQPLARSEFEAFQHQQYLKHLDRQHTPDPATPSRLPQSWPRREDDDYNSMHPQSHGPDPAWASQLPQRQGDPPFVPSAFKTTYSASSTQPIAKNIIDPDDGY